MSLVDTNWLEENLDKVKIIDCSWHMPQTERNGFDEYKNNHIKNAIFFDLDKNSKKDTDLPHMLPNVKSWEDIVSNMGIKNDDQIIIYDNSDVISSCRCWYNFIYFGHNPNLIKVLDGGLKKWVSEKKPTTNDIVNIEPSHYSANEKIELVKNRLPLTYSLFENDALIFKKLKSKQIQILETGLPKLNFTFKDFPNLGIWTNVRTFRPCESD